MILQINQVSKIFSGHQALTDVSFDIEKGKIFGLLGPNGAGKTTLIRIINKILEPESGSVYFNGKAITNHAVRSIGYLPEERGLYKKMKVGEQLLYLAQLKGVEKSEGLVRIKNWLTKLDLLDWSKSKVEDLSKGMQQKIQFISTVLHDPELIILDEPFSGFDPINTNLIKNEIKALQEKGTTIIFSTHNMESVEEICDDIVLINRSKKILEGSVEEIKNSFKENLFHLKFKGDLIGFTNALWTDFELMAKKNNGNLHEVKVKSTNGKSLNVLLEHTIKEVEILHAQEILPSMNEIFINQVSKENLQDE
jgi:ABC-2 type transport system ATP-binding protein